MYEAFSKLIENIRDFMYSYLLIILLLVVGLYFTFRTKFIQARLLGESIRVVAEKKGDKNSFQHLISAPYLVALQVPR